MRPDEAENEELSAPQSSLDVLQPATLVSSIQNRPINAFNSESSLLSLMNVPTHPTDNTSALVSSQPSVGHHRAFDRFDRGPQSRLVLVGGKDKKFNQSTTQWLHELVDRSPHSSDLNQDQRSVSSSSGSSHYCQSFIDNQPRSRGKLHLRNHQRSSKALPPKAPKDCIHPLLTPSSSPVTATTTSSLSVVSNSCLTTTTSSIHPSHPSPHPYEVYARVDDDDDEKWSHQEPNNLVGNSTSKNTNNDTDDIYETPYASVTVADDGPTSPSQCQSQSANWPNCPCPSLLHLHDGNVLSPTGSTTTTSDGGGVDMRSILRPTINSLLTASANKSQHDHQQLDGQVLPLSTGGSVHFQIAMDRDGDDKDGAMEWVVKKRPDGSRYITRRPIRNRLLKEYNQHSKEQHLSGIVAEEREVPDINHSPKRETLMGTIHHSQTRSRHRNHLSYSPDRHRKRSISKKNHKHDRNRHIQQKSRRTKSNRAKYSCTEKETSIKVLHSDQTLAKMEVRKSGTCCEKKTEVHDPKSVVSNSFQLVTMTTV